MAHNVARQRCVHLSPPSPVVWLEEKRRKPNGGARKHLVHSCTGSATSTPTLSTLIPSLSPSMVGIFIETSQLLITAGDSERACGF